MRKTKAQIEKEVAQLIELERRNGRPTTLPASYYIDELMRHGHLPMKKNWRQRFMAWVRYVLRDGFKLWFRWHFVNKWRLK